MKRIVFLWNQSNTFGLSQDAALIEHAIVEANKDNYEIEFVRLDPLQPPSNADVVIHLEIPHPVWLPWAPVHIWMVNPEWCSPAWLPYAERFTQVWVKEQSRLEDFGPNVMYVPWAVKGPLKPVKPDALGLRQALWVLGASQNKHAAARVLLPLWPTNFPLTVTTTLEEADLSGASLFPASVTVKRGFLEASELEELNRTSAIHVCISAAEGFGFTAAQAEARSAGLLLNTLPVYEEYYKGRPYASFLNTPTRRSNPDHMGFVADFSAVTTNDIKAALQVVPYGEEQVQESEGRLKDFVRIVGNHIIKFLNTAKEVRKMPPTIAMDVCPPISVLTLTYNRRNFIDLAFINMLVTDYPKSKIQWVIVEDSDDPAKASMDKIKAFESRDPQIEITYVPMSHKRSIGYKRNRAVKAAKHDICLNMDDDDVYPETSFRRRVAWLLSAAGTGKKVVGCTTIAMYDLNLGISAVNTPPWALKQSQRVSEASFCFYKDFALENPFPDVQQSEGEGFVDKCMATDQFLEIPPQQILVALNHGTNTSGRVIAGRAQTGCFWGWDQRFITWLHGLIGVQVESAPAVESAA
jgi:hypothetical protein